MCVCVCVCVCVCACACVCACLPCNLLHRSHVQHSCNLLCSPTVTPPMYLLHKYTYTYTHTYIHTHIRTCLLHTCCHCLQFYSLLSLHCVPHREADDHLSSWTTQSTTGQCSLHVHMSLYIQILLYIPYLFLYVFVLVDYVFFPIFHSLYVVCTCYLLTSFFHFII